MMDSDFWDDEDAPADTYAPDGGLPPGDPNEVLPFGGEDAAYPQTHDADPAGGAHDTLPHGGDLSSHGTVPALTLEDILNAGPDAVKSFTNALVQDVLHTIHAEDAYLEEYISEDDVRDVVEEFIKIGA